MAVEPVNIFHGARYQNLWCIEEPSQQMDCAIHFWIYWEALQAAAIAVPWVSPYAMAKYQRILWFAIGSHSIHIQARRDPDRQWLPLPYKVTTEYLDTIMQDWPGDWHVPMSQEEIDKELPPKVPKDHIPQELSTHDYDNESSTEPEYAAKRMLEETHTKWCQEYETGSSTKSGMEDQLQQLIKSVIDFYLGLLLQRSVNQTMENLVW